MLVKTKLVSLNLYELIKDKIEEQFVDLSETEKQLDKVLVPVQRRPKCTIIGALLDVHSFLLLFFVKVKMFVHDYSLAWTKLLREQNGIKKGTK